MESENIIKELLGDKLLKIEKDEIKEVNFDKWYSEFHPNSKYIILYFGAHWVPTCRLINPNVKEKFYNPMLEDELFKGKLEIVFVSEDREESHYKRHIK